MSQNWEYIPGTGHQLTQDDGFTGSTFVRLFTVNGRPRQLASSGAIRATIASTDHNVGICVYGTADLNEACWRIGVDATNITIRRRTNGSLAAAVVTQAHGLSTGVPFTIEVRPYTGASQQIIEVRINGAASAICSYDTAGVLAEYSTFGIDSAVLNALVPKLEIGTLRPITRARADIPYFVCGGELWASVDGTNLQRVDARAMNAIGPVDSDDLDQIVYLVDGVNAKKFNPADMTVSKYTPSAGTLPGQTDDGTTRSTIIENYSGRILVTDEQNILGSKVNDAMNFDDGAITPGAAFSLSAAVAGRIGQPVRALLRTSSTRLLIGCSRSIWQMRGDFALGGVEITPILEDVGVLDKDAMLRITDDLVLAHTTQGLYVIAPPGVPTPLSRNTLNTFLTVGTNDGTYTFHLARDVKRSQTLIFITKQETGESIHIRYDERVGQGFQGPAFFPEKYPDRIGPMCAMAFNGEVFLGGRDGYVYTYDDVMATDDGDNITSKLAFNVLTDPDLTIGGHVLELDTMLADDSGEVDVKVYSGQTAMEAFQGAGRFLRRQVRSSPKRRRHTINVAAPAIVVEIHGVAGTRWALEPMQAEIVPSDVRRDSYGSAPTLSAPQNTANPVYEEINSSELVTGPKDPNIAGPSIDGPGASSSEIFGSEQYL